MRLVKCEDPSCLIASDSDGFDGRVAPPSVSSVPAQRPDASTALPGTESSEPAKGPIHFELFCCNAALSKRVAG